MFENNELSYIYWSKIKLIPDVLSTVFNFIDLFVQALPSLSPSGVPQSCGWLTKKLPHAQLAPLDLTRVPTGRDPTALTATKIKNYVTYLYI